MPLTSAFFLVGVIAITALPPLSGFVSEFLIYYGFLDIIAGDSAGIVAAICGIVAVSLIGGVVILAFTKLYGVVFLGSPRSQPVKSAAEADALSLAGFAVPAAGILSVGLLPGVFVGGFFSLASRIIGVEYSPLLYSSFTGRLWEISAAAGVLAALTGMLLLVRYLIVKRHREDRSPVWGCGFTAGTHKMQYSSESFSEGLYGISTSLTKNSGGGEVVEGDEIFPTPHSFDLRHRDKVSTLLSSWWVESVRKINKRAARLNTGKVNHYVLYALVFLVLVFFLTITGII